jgi:hypothetical protein
MLSQTATAQTPEIQIWPVDRFIFNARNPRKNDATVHRMRSSKWSDGWGAATNCGQRPLRSPHRCEGGPVAGQGTHLRPLVTIARLPAKIREIRNEA